MTRLRIVGDGRWYWTRSGVQKRSHGHLRARRRIWIQNPYFIPEPDAIDR